MPGETLNRIELRAFTSSKDETLENCYSWGRKLDVRLEMAFGKGSAEAKSFPSKQLSEAEHSENKMMAVLEVVIALAEKHQTTLADFGQTPEVVQQGKDFLSELRTRDALQEQQKDAKLSATQERYQKFIGIYDEVNKINRVGRIVFKNDPVKSVLFESKWPTRKNAQIDPEEIE